MANIVLNDTPVRTSKSFKINNIELENICIPDNLKEFKNVSITNTSSKITINSSIQKADLKYGLSKVLLNQINESSNYNANILAECKTNNEVITEFLLDNNDKSLVEHINITATEGSKSTFIFKYKTEQDVQAYHNGLIKLTAKKDSVIDVIIVNFMNENSDNLFCIENNIEENARVHYYIIDIGGKTSITNYYSNITGENADNNLNTIYLGRNNQVFDLNYIAELYGKKSNINIEVQGALKDNAKKNFKGTIDFKKGCKKATGNENENCMLLSDKAKSLALPMLLCSEEDVEGNHSTSSGKIGEKELFYIMSRGFELKEAMKLMVRAKFNKILESIKNDELKEEIQDKISACLD